MNEDNELRVGEVYETTIKISNRGYTKKSNGDILVKTIYIGKLSIKGILYSHVIISRGGGKEEAFRFEKYELKNGTLNIFYALRSKISELERKFIEERLERVGL